MSTFSKYKKHNVYKNKKKQQQKSKLTEDSSYVTKGRLTVDSLYGIFAKSASSEAAIRDCRSRKRNREKAEKSLQKITRIHQSSAENTTCLISPVASTSKFQPVERIDVSESLEWNKENVNKRSSECNVYSTLPIIAETRESSSQTSVYEIIPTKDLSASKDDVETKNTPSTVEGDKITSSEKFCFQTSLMKKFTENINNSLIVAASALEKNLDKENIFMYDTFTVTKDLIHDSFYTNRPLTTPPSNVTRISSNLEKMNDSLEINDGIFHKLELRQVSSSSSSPGYTVVSPDYPKTTILTTKRFLKKYDNLSQCKQKRKLSGENPSNTIFKKNQKKSRSNLFIKRNKDVIVNPLQYLRNYEMSSVQCSISGQDSQPQFSISPRQQPYSDNIFPSNDDNHIYSGNVGNRPNNRLPFEDLTTAGNSSRTYQDYFRPFSQSLVLREPNSMPDVSRNTVHLYPRYEMPSQLVQSIPSHNWPFEPHLQPSNPGGSNPDIFNVYEQSSTVTERPRLSGPLYDKSFIYSRVQPSAGSNQQAFYHNQSQYTPGRPSSSSEFAQIQHPPLYNFPYQPTRQVYKPQWNLDLGK